MSDRIDAQRMWRVLVDALDPLPNSEFTDRPDWVQLRTPSSPSPSHNNVMRAQLAPDAVEAKVRAVVDDHAERGAGWLWVVDQDSAPADQLSATIERLSGSTGEIADAMARRVPRGPLPEAPVGVRIVPVREDLIETLGDVSMRGWKRPPTFRKQVIAWARRGIARPDNNVLHWLAYLDDEAVGCCTLTLVPGVGYLQGACVFEEARGRGIYTAMTWARMAALTGRGIEDVVIWAHRPTSAPIVVKMGFEAITSARFHQCEQPQTPQ